MSETTKTTFAALRSGDYFLLPGSTIQYAKVHQRYIQTLPRKIGSYTLPGHTPVELVGHATFRERKVEL